MADRTVNININYKVNTADIQRAQAASQAAQKATDALRKSAQDYGKTAQQASKTASDGLKQVSESTKKASADTQGLSQSFSGLYGAVRAVVTAGVVRELVDMTLNMAILAGRTDGVTRAFKRLPESTALLINLRKATHDTVTDFELMQRTLQATNLGVGVQHLGILFEFAAARAQQTGESVDYLVDSIVRGIGRKSILILDNLGLSATRLREQFNGASLASQSVADVTAGVAEIAKVELQKMGGYIDTAETKAKQLTKSFEELKTSAAQRLESGGVIDFLNDGLRGLKSLLDTMPSLSRLFDWQNLNPIVMVKDMGNLILEWKKNVDALALSQEAQKQALEEVERIKQRSIGTQQQQIDFVQQEINSRVQLIGRYNDNIKALKEQRSELSKTNPYDIQIDNIGRSIRAFNDNKLSIAAVIVQLKEYLTAISKTVPVDSEQSGLIERKKEEIKLLEEQIEKTNNLSDLQTKVAGTGVTVAGPLIRALEIAKSELEALEKSFNNFDIKAFKIEPIKNVTKEFTNIEEVTKRVEENLKLISEGLITLAQGKPGLVDLRTELELAFAAQKELLVTSGIDIVADQLSSIAQLEADSYNIRISQLQSFYDDQIDLAGDNENAKDDLRKKEQREIDALRREQFKKEREAQRLQVIINTAASIAKTAATLGYPAAIPFIVLAALQGAAQLAIINRQTPRFAKGVLNLKGPGTETSDSIPSLLSKGESVMTAAETRKSFGILEAIKDNRLDDRILKRLHLSDRGVSVVPWDNRPVVEAINKNRAPNLVREGRLIYETYEDRQKHKKFVRSKSI